MEEVRGVGICGEDDMAGGEGAAGGVQGVSSVSKWLGPRFDTSHGSVGLQIEVVVLDQMFEDESDEFIRPETTSCGGQSRCWGAIDPIFQERILIIDEGDFSAQLRR